MTAAQFEQNLLGGTVLSRLGLFGLGVDLQVVKQHFTHLGR